MNIGESHSNMELCNFGEGVEALKNYMQGGLPKPCWEVCGVKIINIPWILVSVYLKGLLKKINIGKGFTTFGVVFAKGGILGFMLFSNTNVGDLCTCHNLCEFR